MATNAARAQATGAEVLPDAGDGAGPEQSGEAVNEMGLTPAEQAEFDAMRTGEPAPADDAGDDGDGESGEPDAGEGEGEGERAQREPGEEPEAREQQRTPKTVNYNKYKRELDRANQALEAERVERQKERENGIKLAERVKMIDEALRVRPQQTAEEQEAEAPPPNPFQEEDIDPNEDFAAAVAQVNRRVKFQNENQNQFVEQANATQEDRALKDTFERDFRSYAQTDPSILPAYQFLKDSRLTEICITKFDKDPNDPAQVFTPDEVQAMVNLFNQEEKWVVSEAIKAKKSPAAAIMKLAKARGFKPAAAAPAAPAAKAPAATPRAPVAPRAPQQPDTTQQLADLRRNQEDGRSLSDAGGAPPGGLSADLLVRMSDAEFAEMIDQMSQHQLDTLMGRVPT